MLHILYGPDSFSRTEAITALKHTLDTDGMLASNTNVLDAKALTFGQLTMICDAAPFLAAARLVVVDGLLARAGGRVARRGRGGAAAKLPEEWQALPAYVAAMPPTTALVLSDGDVPAENGLLEALAEHGRVRNFPRMPARALEGWIMQRAKAARVTLEPAAAKLLAESAPQDVSDGGEWHALWGLVNDLEKLSLFAGDRPVSAEDVRRLTPAAADTNVFAFVDAVVERRGDEAVRRLTGLLFAGQPPPVLLAMLARGFRQLVLYSDLAAAGARPEEIARRLNVRPEWRVQRLREQAARYRPQRLATIYDRILAADRSIKRGEADETAALELLTAELAALA